MQKSEFNQGVSFKIFMHPRERTDQTHSLYLRVIIDRKKREFNLKVTWPMAFFDEKRQIAKPRHPKDPDVQQINMIINEAKGRSARIKLRYFTDSRTLTLDNFQREFENYESRDNFLFFWTTKQNQLLGRRMIAKQTGVRHQLNFNRFTEFIGNTDFFSMAELKHDLIMQYKSWLVKKKKLMYNTSVNALKTLKAYVNHAISDGYKIDDPFVNIKLSYQQGDRVALDRVELEALRAQLLDEDIPAIQKEVLRKFLFSCYTGLRISDSAHITRSMITDNSIKVTLVKGERFGKRVVIPMPAYARDLIAGRSGVLFEKIADQTCNMWLKVIAKEAKIKKRLTFHVSRDTFATLFIELGGDVFTLKEILGHSSVKTTELYVKMSDKRKQDMMNNFDGL